MRSKPNTGLVEGPHAVMVLVSNLHSGGDFTILEKSEYLELLTQLCLSNGLWCHQGSLTPSSLALTGCLPHSQAS